MKKCIFFAWYHIIAMSAYSQFSVLAHHTGSETSFNIAGIGGASYYMVRIQPLQHSCVSQLYFVGNNTTGKEKFRVLFSNVESYGNATLFATKDKHIICSGGSLTNGCDVLYPKFYVKKYDTTGTEVWSFSLNKVIVDLIDMPDSTFYVVMNDALTRYDYDGNPISGFSAGGVTIQKACLIASDKILVSCSNGLNWIYKMFDTLGNSSLNAYAPILNQLFSTSSGKIYAVSDSDVVQLSKNLTVLNTIAKKVGYNYKAISGSGEDLFICGRDSQSRPFVMRTDTNLNILQESTSNIEGAVATGVYHSTLNEYHVVVTGWSGIKPSNSYSSFFKTGPSMQLNSNEDIGVTGFSLTVDPVYRMYPGPGVRATLEADVKIKNFGNNKITSFCLNHYGFGTGFFHWLTGLNREYTISVDPGQEVVVQTGTFFTAPFFGNVNSYDKTYPFDICLNTTIPNRTPDNSISNDFFCETFTMVPVGLGAESLNQKDLKIYPNPTNSGFTITAPEIITVIQLIDISGRKVFEQENNSQSLFIPVDTIRPGLYFVKYETEHSSGVEKVVIEP